MGLSRVKERKMVKRTLLLVFLIIATFMLVGCQTIQGLGNDIKWVGEQGAEIIGQ
jgi:predicted small secreted protein